jgi:O-acetyl-ADP-ribose deacetylase (regulator of RNase III)
MSPDKRKARIVHGDLLAQPVEAIVNAWNRNLIPWWLLLPKGISGAIKKKAGVRPFQELRHHGLLPLGGAATTSAGRLPFKGIIHVAGIGHTWTASEHSIRQSVRSALQEAQKHGFRSLGFPLIGAGTGGFKPDEVKRLMIEEIERADYNGECLVVLYEKQASSEKLKTEPRTFDQKQE